MGTPFNLNQFAFLGHLIAHLTNHVAVKLVHAPKDYHIYEDQIEMMPKQFTREPIFIEPKLEISEDVRDIDAIQFSDFTITGYGEGCYHPPVKYPVAI